ncbi:MAG: aspartate carbamoyltransferase [Candidatus Hadarchaeales archaeon]
MFKNRDVISILDFSDAELEKIFEVSKKMEKTMKKGRSVLKGKILANAFFEPSTRTRLSFETAMHKLGGSVIGFTDIEATSIAKGENLADTIRMLDAYADVIAIRHKVEGAAKLAAEIADAPVINAGDGTKNHPTQAMVDLYTVWKEFGRIDGLNFVLMGDLRYGRAVASFLYALTKFKPRKIYLVSPPLLKPRKELEEHLTKSGVNFEIRENLQDIIQETDVLYVTRIQRERFPDPAEYEKVKGSYRVDLETIKNAKDGMIIMHPLPRVGEIALEVDTHKSARYFQQAANGVPVRMALLYLLLEGEK